MYGSMSGSVTIPTTGGNVQTPEGLIVDKTNSTQVGNVVNGATQSTTSSAVQQAKKE